jgi:hypothetical protein
MGKILIIGDPQDGFTSATIDDNEGNYVGRVFELDDGWYIHLEDVNILEEIEVRKLIQEAKTKLMKYPNRKGAEFPEDMTAGAISLWLLEKSE